MPTTAACPLLSSMHCQRDAGRPRAPPPHSCGAYVLRAAPSARGDLFHACLESVSLSRVDAGLTTGTGARQMPSVYLHDFPLEQPSLPMPPHRPNPVPSRLRLHHIVLSAPGRGPLGKLRGSEQRISVAIRRLGELRGDGKCSSDVAVVTSALVLGQSKKCARSTNWGAPSVLLLHYAGLVPLPTSPILQRRCCAICQNARFRGSKLCASRADRECCA